ncbi:4-hydroxythreonine-4-phosphate dehydrogenase PdxA [Helicobacter sp. 23-1044]
MKKVAISIGDINGVGAEIALKAHSEISKIIKPVYFVDLSVIECASKLLKFEIPRDFEVREIAPFCSKNLRKSIAKNTLICPATATKESGEYSFVSFTQGVSAVESGKMDAILTLPINKFAWKRAGIDFVGHTEFLRAHFGAKSADLRSDLAKNSQDLHQNSQDLHRDSQDSHNSHQNGIMMLGCDEMFIALFTDHIPLNAVASHIEFDAVRDFLLLFHAHFSFKSALVLGLNPHAGDGGVLGSEDEIIQNALDSANKTIGAEIYKGIVAPDSAFRAQNRAKFKVFVAMYHDQGLSVLKALYAEKSINVTLGIPILRVSVEHGTGFDISYRGIAGIDSYKEAVKFIAKH